VKKPVTPPTEVPLSEHYRFPVVTSVTCDNYYPVRLTDITIAADTVIDFELTLKKRARKAYSQKFKQTLSIASNQTLQKRWEDLRTMHTISSKMTITSFFLSC
jgi:hypothetical protein